MADSIQMRAPLFTSLEAYGHYFKRIHDRTVEVIGAIPPDRLDWRPAPGEWSLADIARHIPSIYLMNIRRVVGQPLRYPGHSVRFGATLPEIRRYVDRCYAEFMAHLSEQPDVILTAAHRVAGGHHAPGWLILMANIEHTIHHRSQIATYLKTLGVEPPALYGIFAEDLPIE